MEKTAIQIAIEKIDEQIEVAQACRIAAAKVKDETSMNRHYGKKIGLVFFRQELVNLLEIEKQHMKMAQMYYSRDVIRFKTLLEKQFEEWYNETFNKTK